MQSDRRGSAFIISPMMVFKQHRIGKKKLIRYVDVDVVLENPPPHSLQEDANCQIVIFRQDW